MIKSMTGYSYREFIYNNRKFVINIKSLNSRFLDIKINLPKELSNAESEIQNIISENIQRGKIEFEIFIENMNNNDLLKIDYSILEEYFNLISDICDRYKIQKNITLGDIINLINSLKSKKLNNNIYDKFIKEEIIEAINLLNKMREKEGKIIYKKILPILSEIKSNLKKIEKRMPNIIKEYEKRLKEKISKILDTQKFDENRILTEVALLVDKTDINEEIQRLQSHIVQFYDYLKLKTPVGKNLEFILQEMVRETNTIGSKVGDIIVTKKVIKIKELIEKLREHCRNIE